MNLNINKNSPSESFCETQAGKETMCFVQQKLSFVLFERRQRFVVRVRAGENRANLFGDVDRLASEITRIAVRAELHVKVEPNGRRDVRKISCRIDYRLELCVDANEHFKIEPADSSGAFELRKNADLQAQRSKFFIPSITNKKQYSNSI